MLNRSYKINYEFEIGVEWYKHFTCIFIKLYSQNMNEFNIWFKLLPTFTSGYELRTNNKKWLKKWTKHKEKKLEIYFKRTLLKVQRYTRNP